ncbi:MAG: glycosyltransferase family 39 protein [Bryobacteraceae bacterium]|nr:glycosyltransferase family 39 protein [Bryobacteraceae bacterium]
MAERAAAGSKVSGAACIAGGALLVLAAALLTGPGIEQALRGEATGALKWGPALFRALLGIHGVLLAAIGIWAWRRWPKASADRYKSEARATPGVLFALGLLCAAALALRLHGLDAQLWYDEVLTLVEFVRLPLGRIVTTFTNQNQHMLYSIMARVAMDWFGESAWTLRLPAVLFGVASIAALFPLARKLTSVSEALLACALMTFSYHHIWFSQNARGYSGLLFFSILATWLWLEAIERNRWRWWLWYAATLALGMWTQMTLAFVIAAHGMTLGIEWLRRRGALSLWKAAAAYALSGALTLQLYALTAPEFLHSAVGEVSMPSAWTNPLWLVTETLRNLRAGFVAWAAVAAGGILVLAGWWSILRRNRAAALVMLLSVGLCAVTMLLAGHNLWPRFFYFAAGFAIIIVIHGTALAPRLLLAAAPGLRRWETPLRRAGEAAALLLIAASAVTIPRAYLPKQDFVGAREYVNGNRQPGDAVLTTGLAAKAYSDYYAPEWRETRTAAELEQAASANRRVWLVYTLPIQIQGFLPEVWKTIQRDFQVVKVFPGTLGGGELYVCRERVE